MLYQKGTERIEVIVRKEGGVEKAGIHETQGDRATANGGDETSEASGSANSSSERFKRVNITHAIATVRQVGLLGANYIIQGIGYQQGDQNYQDYIQRRVEIMQDATGFASSVAMGATYGAAGGAPGIALGVLFSVISSTASLGAKYASRQRDYDVKMFKENNSIEHNRARAQVNLTNGRLR